MFLKQSYYLFFKLLFYNLVAFLFISSIILIKDINFSYLKLFIFIFDLNTLY